MKAFEEIFEGIKERVRNPFIFSFICGWLVINWRIIVALLYYDVSPVNEANIERLLWYLSSKLSFQNSFCLPLAVGLGYTFLMPIFRYFLRMFNAWINQKGENKVLDIIKTGKMPVAKYLKLRENHIKQTEKLEELISSESATLDNLTNANNALDDARMKILDLQRKNEEVRSENQKMKNSVTSLTTEKENLNKKIDKQAKEISQLESSSNLQMINGRWINSFELNGANGTEEVEIEDGKYYIITNRGRVLAFEIKCFSFDFAKNRVSFLKINQNMQKPFESAHPNKAADISTIRSKYLFNELRFFENNTVMMGSENGLNNVRYTRTGNLVTDATK